MSVQKEENACQATATGGSYWLEYLGTDQVKDGRVDTKGADTS